jgi:hypothetical protein
MASGSGNLQVPAITALRITHASARAAAAVAGMGGVTTGEGAAFGGSLEAHQAVGAVLRLPPGADLSLPPQTSRLGLPDAF